MKKLKVTASSLVITACLLSPMKSQAFFGDIVFDPTAKLNALQDLADNVTQISNQVTMITNQIQAYENMVQNTLAPAMYIYDQVQEKMLMLTNISSTIEQYKNQFGDVDSYLSKFRDVNYYRQSPCFKASFKCTPEQLQELHDGLNFGSEQQKKSNDSWMKGIEAQQNGINDDVKTLQKLQKQASSAKGQMQALGAANQLASAEINQLMQIREAMLAANTALAARQQALQDVEAMQKAAGDALRKDNTKIVNENKSWGF